MYECIFWCLHGSKYLQAAPKSNKIPCRPTLIIVMQRSIQWFTFFISDPIQKNNLMKYFKLLDRKGWCISLSKTPVF